MSHQTQFQLQQITGVLSNVVQAAQLGTAAIRPSSNVVTLVRIPCFLNGSILPPSTGQTQFIQVIAAGSSPSTVCTVPAVCSPSASYSSSSSSLSQVHAVLQQQQQQQRQQAEERHRQTAAAASEDQCAQDQIDLRVRNVVSMFNVCCHVNLHKMAMLTPNVIYEQNRGVVMWQLRNPSCHARVSACGKVIVTGASSEVTARRASRRVARWIEKNVNGRVRFADYRVTNMMASCKLPFGIRLRELANAFPKQCSYEPEITSGLVWRNKAPKMTLRIHSTGSVTITGATSERNVLTAMDALYPVLVRYKINNCPSSQPIIASQDTLTVNFEQSLMFSL